jgi:oligopeptide/dipeptide ABC transporter ATP-binding protein
MRKIRGNEIGMIFQEPMTSLNPVFTVGYQIAEVYQTHRGMTKTESLAAAQKMLESVKIPSPEQRLHEYPHQLSGGMRQRVMIAMALACQPSLLIADEPTTALDVTVQAQILELMKELKDQMQSSILMITHDLGIIAGFADRVAVMYAGQIVEQGPVEDIFEHPSHPYTRGLLNSIPKFKTGDERKQGYTKLITIEGTVPDPLHFPTGCRFNPRCKYAIPECYQQMPLLKEIVPGHQARCYLAEKLYQDNHESK